MECFKCGISGDKALLFDAISNKGIIKICEKCFKEENIPIISKPIDSQINEYKKKTKEPPQIKRSVVYERLSHISGIRVEDGREEKSFELLEKEDDLKKIANKNFQEKLEEKPSSKPYLVDNFHWIIMRARRLEKITAEQLAKKIVEPESAIKMAEKGILPEDDKKLISKLESHLGVSLVKEEFREKIKETEMKKPFLEKMDFKSDETKTLTISDLQEMKKRREEIFEKPIKEEIIFNEEVELGDKEGEKPEFVIKDNEVEKESSDKDLTDKDIDDILFGRK
jgi:ribosome-binding protein aMBF1 (putative translation factor)